MGKRAEGWYADPDRPGTERWWDGKTWTGLARHRAHVHPHAGTTRPPEAIAEKQHARPTFDWDDVAVWLAVAWPFVAIGSALFLPYWGPFGTFVSVNVHLGIAALDISRNPRLEELSWRRTSLVFLPPVYIARRQRLLDRPTWPWLAWILSLVLGYAVVLIVGLATASITDVPIAEVELVIGDSISTELPEGVTVEVECGDGPLTEGGTIDCLATFSDGSSVVLRTTTTLDEITWERVEGTESPADA